jgi:hypothetical protein
MASAKQIAWRKKFAKLYGKKKKGGKSKSRRLPMGKFVEVPIPKKFKSKSYIKSYHGKTEAQKEKLRKLEEKYIRDYIKLAGHKP